MSDNLVQLSDYLKRPTEPPLPSADLKPPSGGGTSDGMDLWQQSVETRLGQLHADLGEVSKKLDSRFLWLLGAFAAGFLALMSMINATANRIDSKFDAIGAKIDGLSSQLSATDQRVARIEGALSRPGSAPEKQP